MEPVAPLGMRPIDAAGARAVIAWRYEPPYDIYHVVAGDDDLPAIEAFLTDPANAYYLIEGPRGEIEAFCCFGHDAQVAGGAYPAGALDLGLGVRPDLTGRGLGRGYAAAVVAYARAHWPPQPLRVTIASFNQRAQRVWGGLGFRQIQAFRSDQGLDFVILMLPVSEE